MHTLGEIFKWYKYVLYIAFICKCCVQCVIRIKCDYIECVLAFRFILQNNVMIRF